MFIDLHLSGFEQLDPVFIKGLLILLFGHQLRRVQLIANIIAVFQPNLRLKVSVPNAKANLHVACAKCTGVPDGLAVTLNAIFNCWVVRVADR